MEQTTEKNSYFPLHQVADAALMIIDQYKSGTKFGCSLDVLALHLMYLEKFIDTGRAYLGEPRTSNEKSFKELVAKMDTLRKEISEILFRIDYLNESDFITITNEHGVGIGGWFRNGVGK